MASAEASLTALGTDYLDILLLHRPDALVEPEEVARAFDHLRSSGKVRAFGVSNHTPRQSDLLKTAVTQPLVANQVQLSITHSSIIAPGLSADVASADDAIMRDGGGLVGHARISKITLQPWPPFHKGSHTGVVVGRRRRARPGWWQGSHADVVVGSEDYPELSAELERLADTCEVEPISIAVAWITRHPAGS